MNEEQNKNSVEQTQVPIKNEEKVTEVSNEAESKVESKAFTEDQVEAIVQRRLDRYKKNVSTKLDGLDIDEAKKLLEEKKQKEQELALQEANLIRC